MKGQSEVEEQAEPGEVRGQPEEGCRLEPLVTKNRSLFSGVGDGSLVKSTSLHTEEGEREP